MTATLIDGKACAAQVCEKVSQEAAALQQRHKIVPTLAVVLVGEDLASQVYVRNKIARTRACNMCSRERKMNATTSQADLIGHICELNNDPDVHGILVQLPLPGHIDSSAVIAAIDPDKDVDGFHALNAGRLATGAEDGFVPCTPLGCLTLLKQQHETLSGLTAVVVGRSNIVGKPMLHLLLGEHCTVTVAHSRTRELAAVVRQADIVVAAVGSPRLVTVGMLKPGCTVIDVGINREAGALVGDVDFEEARHVAGAITPVPGGVGPMTIAMLLQNTIRAACLQHGVAL